MEKQIFPWAQGFNTYLVTMVTKTGGVARYWAAHKLVPTISHLLGRHPHVIGVPTHSRPLYLKRYGAKRVLGYAG